MPSTKTKQKDQELDFEQSIKELEKIVKQLESGKVGLAESLKMFESGIEHYQNCQKTLDATEKKITVLTEKLEKEYQANDE